MQRTIDTATPGAELAPIDKVAHRCGQIPQYSGQAWGIAYAAYTVDKRDLLGGDGYTKLYLMRADTADLLPDKVYRHGYYRDRDWHSLPLLAGRTSIREYCQRIYWREVYGCTHPLDAVQETITAQTEQRREEARRQMERRSARRQIKRSPSAAIMADGTERIAP